MKPRIVAPCLVVLVGPSGSGKSRWANRHFAKGSIVSSDGLRAAVGLDEFDQRASADAFFVLDEIVRRRVARKLTTVVDTLGMNKENRETWISQAREAGLDTYAVTFSTDAKVCRARNKQRARPVPAKALTGQLSQYRRTLRELAAEDFDGVLEAADDTPIVNRSMRDAGIAADRQQSHPVSLEFGLQVSSFNFAEGSGAARGRLGEIAAAAEEAGFASLWVMDHFIQIPQVGPDWADMLESYTTLAFLAGVTHRIKLGTLVTGVGYRNPAHLAKILATLDVLSGGRALCGLGAGWFEREAVAYGWNFESAGRRLDRLEDVLQLLPLMWGPGGPAFEGRTFSVPAAVCYPRPLQDKIPILVGGGGERRTLRLVAQYADMANLFGDAATVRRKVGVLGEHCAAVGRDPSEIRITHFGPTLVGTSPADLGRRVEALRPTSRSVDEFGATVNAGTIADQVGRFRSLTEAGVHVAIVALPDLTDATAVTRFEPIIDAFSG